MNYFNKYFKYKNKYLNLKNQIGGNGEFYMPCEITHFTDKVYYSETISYKVNYLIGPSSIGFKGRGYYQDPYVQLYNDELNCYYNLFTNNWPIYIESSAPYCITDKCNYKCRYPERGNCIINNSDNIIINKDEIIPSDLRTIRYIKVSGETANHIIVDITTEINKYPDFIDDINEQINIDKDNNSEREQCKGGNFISAPNGTIFCITGANKEFIDKIKEKSKYKVIELECGFKASNFRHIDELMCFMPYGNGKYKVWYYDELNNKSFSSLFREFNTDGGIIPKIQGESYYTMINKPINLIIERLNEERMANLNIISNELFDKPYEECKDNFVFFNYYSYKPSIFNRTWYETKESVKCLFPRIIDFPDKKKFDYEINQIKSYIDSTKSIYFSYIDVADPNELIPEGTVHCLIKQRFIKPT